MLNRFFLFASIALMSCQAPPQGVAHRAVNDLYPYYTIGKWMYSESMIRAALKTAQVDSNFVLSRDVEYIFQYDADTTVSWFLKDTETRISETLLANEAELMLSYQENGMHTKLYAITEDTIITDLVYIKQDGTLFTMYEVVGRLSLPQLFKAGLQNRTALENFVPFNSIVNARIDSSNP